MTASSLIGNLAVTLSLDTAAFQRGATVAEKRAEAMRGRFASVGKSVAGIGAALGAGLLVNGLTSAASGAFDMASALSETAEKAGLTVEALQELRFAAQQNGVSNEFLEASMTKLNKSLGDLQLGKKSAVSAFAAIGLAADDLKGKSLDQSLRIIADALNKIPDVQQRVAIGSQLMGRNFAQLLPLINGGSKALNDYAEEARKNGIITAEEARILDESADAWDKTKLKIQVATAKIIAAFASLEQGVYSWYKVRDSAISAAGEMASKVVGFVNQMVNGIGQAITNRLTAIWNGAKANIDAVSNWFRDLYDAVVGHSYIPDMVEGIAAEMAKLDAVMVQPVQAATGKAAEAFRNLQSETRNLLDRLFPEAASMNRFRADLATLEEAMKRGIITAEQYAEALRRLGTEGNPDEPISVLDQGSLVPGVEDVADSVQILLDKMPQVVDHAQRLRDVLSTVGQDLAQMAGDWLTAFIDGSAKLKDLWRGIAAYAIRALTSPNGPLQQIFGGPRAMGGPVVRGKSYLVGENGPELFAPGSSGRIIPTDDTQAMMGGRRGDIIINGVRDFDSFNRNKRQLGRVARREFGLA